MSEGPTILFALALLLLNAVFVGSEFSLLSSRRDRLEALREQGVARARTVIRASQEGSLMLTSAQLGITLCSLGLGQLGEPAVAGQLEKIIAPLSVPPVVLHSASFVIALAAVVVLHVMIGEMVPKNLAIADPERLALWLVPALVAFTKVARPLIAIFNMLANSVLRLLRVTPKEELETAYTSAELAELLVQSRREGLLEQAEHRRLAQTLSSAEHRVSDVVVPLSDTRALSAQPTLNEVEDAVAATGFSRFPVSGPGGLPQGYLHVKDVLDQVCRAGDAPVPKERVRQLPTVSSNDRLNEALATLRRTGSHLGVAVDDSGTMIGVVALEDLVEEYVGTVRDGTHVTTPAGR